MLTNINISSPSLSGLSFMRMRNVFVGSLVHIKEMANHKAVKESKRRLSF